MEKSRKSDPERCSWVQAAPKPDVSLCNSSLSTMSWQLLRRFTASGTNTSATTSGKNFRPVLPITDTPVTERSTTAWKMSGLRSIVSTLCKIARCRQKPNLPSKINFVLLMHKSCLFQRGLGGTGAEPPQNRKYGLLTVAADFSCYDPQAGMGCICVKRMLFHVGEVGSTRKTSRSTPCPRRGCEHKERP